MPVPEEEVGDFYPYVSWMVDYFPFMTAKGVAGFQWFVFPHEPEDDTLVRSIFHPSLRFPDL